MSCSSMNMSGLPLQSSFNMLVIVSYVPFWLMSCMSFYYLQMTKLGYLEIFSWRYLIHVISLMILINNHTLYFHSKACSAKHQGNIQPTDLCLYLIPNFIHKHAVQNIKAIYNHWLIKASHSLIAAVCYRACQREKTS